MKWLRIVALAGVVMLIALSLPVVGDPPTPSVVYNWIGGRPVKTDNVNYQWIGGRPYGILKWIIVPTVTNSTGASDVTHNSARLNGELTSDGYDGTANITVYWGTTDGGTTPASWTNNASLGAKAISTFYYDASGLSGLTLYYYRYFAQNSRGTDWANSSANFTTLLGGPPTDFVLTDLGGVNVGITWTPNPASTYTMIRVQRNEYPADITDGELVYYYTGSDVTTLGYALETTEYFFRAWAFASDNVTHSSTYAQGSIGGEGMTGVADAINSAAGQLSNFNLSVMGMVGFVALILFTVMAFWKPNPIIFMILAGISISLGLAAPDLLSSKETTTAIDIAIGLALVIYALLCAAWAFRLMLWRDKQGYEGE